MGFIGSHICNRLLKEGAIVRGIYHVSEGRKRLPGVEYVKLDLENQEDCIKAVNGQDFVFMCAANTAGAAVMRETPLAHVTPNLKMNSMLLEAAQREKVKKFVFISSGAAYPATNEVPAKEEDMFSAEPEDVYYAVAWMKRYTEILCKTYAEKINTKMPCLVIRPSNVYGPDDKFDPQKSHVMAALIRRVASREKPMQIWGTGNDIRDFIYVDDFIDGVMKAFCLDRQFLAVNIASGTGYSVKDVLKKLIEVDGFNDAEYSFDVSKPSTTPIRLIDTQLAKQVLAFEAKTCLADGLKNTLKWYRENLLNS
jgi:GDP-L-fucose synthase